MHRPDVADLAPDPSNAAAHAPGRRTRLPIGVPIDELDWQDAVQRIASWARQGESRYVCICNAHSSVTAVQDPEFMRVVREADMATPDGASVAWLMRRLGAQGQARINGPDLMWRYCEHAQRTGESIYLYGGSESTLTALRAQLSKHWPQLNIAGHSSPPFRALTPTEEESAVAAINASGARTVWVSLGCPKQEFWMAAHRGKVQAVMIGVGAAFDYHAGTLRRAPGWVQRAGFEWLFRLASEPRRLWRRYLVTNTAFVGRALGQLLTGRY